MHSNQNSLFGDVSDQSVHVLPDVRCGRQRAAGRKKLRLVSTWAVTLIGHTQKDLSNFITVSLANLTPREQRSSWQAIVSGIRVRMTGRGKMAIVGIDDGTTRIEV